MSDGRIAICDCLLRFANRVAMKPNCGETAGDSSHKHGHQSVWWPSSVPREEPFALASRLALHEPLKSPEPFQVVSQLPTKFGRHLVQAEGCSSGSSC